jgi:signal transduction histidine kinase
MHEIDLLTSIQPAWLKNASQVLAPGSGFQENFMPELERFSNLVSQAIENSRPELLDPIIAEWASSQTESELGSPASSLIEILNSLLTTAVESSQEMLAPVDALQLIHALMKVFGHGLAQAARLDAQAKIEFTSEQLSQTNQVLEKLDRSKSDFIAVSAHELKTPLTLIDGYASMLKETLEQAGINSYQSVLLGGILNGTQRLHDIINDMIDASLIDNEILNLNFQPVWISQLVTILKSENESSIRERRQALEVIPFEGLNQMTYGDPERLIQVFRNVLTNAIKFTPDGGKITISGRSLPGFMEITIADNGIGIDPEYLSLIFEKFVRVGGSALHSSGKTKYKGGGPGLGLHIARGIIESHGGTIWVESPGFDELTCPGSIFHILIPIRSEPPDSKFKKLFAPFINFTQEKGT